MDAQTHHQIVQFGPDTMVLFDNETGQAIAAATRVDGEWILKAEGHEDFPASAENVTPGDPPRRYVIQALVDWVHSTVVGENTDPNSYGNGWSTTVPHGLEDLP